MQNVLTLSVTKDTEMRNMDIFLFFYFSYYSLLHHGAKFKYTFYVLNVYL